MKNYEDYKKYYQETMSEVYGYVYMRSGRNKEVAEDLVSEIFLKALEKFESFSEKAGSFRAWIFKITKNHLIDHYRSSSLRNTDSLDVAEATVASTIEVKKDVKQEIEKEKLYAALSELSKDKKELVVLKYISGYSYKEMAAILREDENKIRVKTFRVVRDLKRKLFELNYEEDE